MEVWKLNDPSRNCLHVLTFVEIFLSVIQLAEMTQELWSGIPVHEWEPENRKLFSLRTRKVSWKRRFGKQGDKFIDMGGSDVERELISCGWQTAPRNTFALKSFFFSQMLCILGTYTLFTILLCKLLNIALFYVFFLYPGSIFLTPSQCYIV
jgi:hypothetical protein